MSGSLTWPSKDPQEVLDYTLDYSGRIPAGDTIVQSSWSVPSGLTAGTTNHANRQTTIWLSGGTDGQGYEITNTVTTAQGRVLEQTVFLVVLSR